LKKSGTLKSGLRSKGGAQKDFHLEYRKSLKAPRGASIKEAREVDEQNKDLQKGARAKKISPKKGGFGPVTVGHSALPDLSATLPAPELEA
jgi:hypothetical protein